MFMNFPKIVFGYTNTDFPSIASFEASYFQLYTTTRVSFENFPNWKGRAYQDVRIMLIGQHENYQHREKTWILEIRCSKYHTVNDELPFFVKGLYFFSI